MSEILFFPWLRISEPVYFENFGLLPYEKENKENYVKRYDQKVVSALEESLDHFYENSDSSDRKIDGATILSINAQITHEIDEALEVKLASLIELIAFCGLSDRDFFRNGESYCNRDNFQLKRFSVESNSVAYKVITRRRDGSNNNSIPKNSFREIIPDHVLKSRVKLNDKFLQSLVSAQSRLENWDDIFQGIANFNLSNSDNSSTSETMELVFLVSAFEQLLGCKNGKEDDLANKFIELFDVSINMNISDCVRLQDRDKRGRFKSCNSIQEIWMKDLFRLRGNLAHGRHPKSYPSLWTLKEHLLLSSFIFPLALKECFSKQNMYTKGCYDHHLLNYFFPRILCEAGISRWREVQIESLLSVVKIPGVHLS